MKDRLPFFPAVFCWLAVALIVMAGSASPKVRVAPIVTRAFGQAAEPTVRGSWAATAGRDTLQGTWTAQPVRDQPNAAQGTWSLINQANQIVATGTWSAAKAPRGWSGSWQARIATGRGAADRILSGTWRADIPAADVSSLGELFRKTLDQQVSGTWARGAFKGAWSLRGSK